MAPLVRRHEAEALAGRLPPLLVAAERVAAAVAPGIHGRRRVGAGDSFWQFRPYGAGDAVARIDWRQTAKSSRAFIRENEWEAAQSVWLWVDRSPSMDWRSERSAPTKEARAALLLLALAAMLVRGGERIALVGSKPSHGGGVLERLARDLEASEAPDGLPPMVKIPRHAALVLFGDFLAPLDALAERLRFYAASGVRGHLLQVLDPAEETLPFDGRVRFEGLENERPTVVSRVEAIRGSYEARLADHRAGLADLARRHGWSFATHRTDHSPQTALLALYAIMAEPPRRVLGTGP